MAPREGLLMFHSILNVRGQTKIKSDHCVCLIIRQLLLTLKFDLMVCCSETHTLTHRCTDSSCILSHFFIHRFAFSRFVEVSSCLGQRIKVLSTSFLHTGVIIKNVLSLLLVKSPKCHSRSRSSLKWQMFSRELSSRGHDSLFVHGDKGVEVRWHAEVDSSAHKALKPTKLWRF